MAASDLIQLITLQQGN